MNKTILVTGANGYIGRHVLDALLVYQDVRIIAIDIVAPDVSSNRVEWISADILDKSFRLEDKLQKKPDVCLHLAWRNGFQHNNRTHMEDLSGHFDFLCQAFDLGIDQIAIMGTMHEIGYWEGPIDEDTPCSPLSLYGIAKNALREASFVLSENSASTLQWLRAFYIHGDDERSQSIFGKIYRAAMEGQNAFPFTTGKNKYDFIEVDELARQIAACVMQDSVSGIINCCTGNPVSLADEVESFIAKHGLDIKLEYGKFPERPYDSPGVWGDASKINSIMGSLQKGQA